MGNFPPGRSRICSTTGLPVCLSAQFFIRVNAVFAVVFLLAGGIAAILLALTRWSAVRLLNDIWYYRLLTFHGFNMLLFWIIFMEIAILYFAGTSLLKSRLFSSKLAWLAFLLMLGGALMINAIVLKGRGDVLFTAYYPMMAHPVFYLGIILFAVGALTAVFNYFGTLFVAKRDGTYQGSVPLVVFGATTAAIIAVVTLLHGAVVMIPAFLWSIGLIEKLDPMWYRLMFWGLGHPSQQINVAAMVAIWYFMATLTTGAKPINQAVCRTAFVLYILFINLASAHHLLVDPAVGSGWKIWNTSYAMYLAVLASMVHGFTVPASVEVAMRKKGHNKGLFGWLAAAPWRDPGFSSFFLSLVIFGFIGGITGVTIGTQQINIIAHNTLRVPGHFHATVVGGTTLAFMGLVYYAVPLIFQREFYWKGLARVQPYVFAAGITLMCVAMTFAGSSGVPRRTSDIEATGAQIASGFSSGAHQMLALLGIGGTIAFAGLMIFILLTVASVFFGRSNAGQPMTSWQSLRPEPIRPAEEPRREVHRTPGTMVLVLILLASFALYYFANWKTLSDVWPVR